MDTELFELCKEVYKRTEWEMPISSRNRWVIVHGGHTQSIVKTKPTSLGCAPLYTSDYLLEKLPKTYDGNWWLVLEPISDSQWSAGYKDAQLEEWADTPLKALLKLTIALHDANQLPTTDTNERKGE